MNALSRISLAEEQRTERWNCQRGCFSRPLPTVDDFRDERRPVIRNVALERPSLSPIMRYAALVLSAWTLQPAIARAAEPTVRDCLTASDASLKFNGEHKLRDERAQLLLCAAEGCPAEIRQECLRRFELVDQSLPSVVFEVKDGTGADVSAVRVTVDDEPLVDRLDGSALAIDPGEHRFTFEIAGKPPLEKRFLISSGQKNRRERISFPLASASTLIRTHRFARSASPEVSHSSMRGQRTAALVVGGIGIAALGVGSFFGLTALSRKHAATSTCPSATCDTESGVAQWEHARAAGNVATVAFIAGGAALAGAATLWFTDTSDVPERPRVGLWLGGVRFTGSW
jgi:hypothetical protein